MTDQELIQLLEKQRDTMVSVSTGGALIDSVNLEYRRGYSLAHVALDQRGLEYTNPFSDLWEWYGRWKSGDFPTYHSRRMFLAGIFGPLISQIRHRAVGTARDPAELLTGWTRVDRTVGEIRNALEQAHNEEQYQAVGLLCREALISLAEAVYDPSRHPTLDGVSASRTDAKRMLEAFVAAEFQGSEHEGQRKARPSGR